MVSTLVLDGQNNSENKRGGGENKWRVNIFHGIFVSIYIHIHMPHLLLIYLLYCLPQKTNLSETETPAFLPFVSLTSTFMDTWIFFAVASLEMISLRTLIVVIESDRKNAVPLVYLEPDSRNPLEFLIGRFVRTQRNGKPQNFTPLNLGMSPKIEDSSKKNAEKYINWFMLVSPLYETTEILEQPCVFNRIQFRHTKTTTCGRVFEFLHVAKNRFSSGFSAFQRAGSQQKYSCRQ